jgi:hypothetical protein
MLTSLGGCTGSLANDNGGMGGSGGLGATGGTTGGSGAVTGGSAGAAGVMGPTLEFTMAMAEALTLEPGETADLEVQAQPPGEYLVRFALLPGPALTPPGDAALSATDLPTNEEGRVSVALTAPSAPTTFLVRASTLGGVSTTLLVTVDKTGAATLRVIAVYPEDGRPWSVWSAAAIPNEMCAMLPGGPFSDKFDWTDAPSKTVELRDVNVGVPLAVVIRAEHFAWGCASVPAVIEGMDNVVSIPASNVPIALSESEVSVSLDLDGFQTAFQTAAEPAVVAALAQVPGSGDDVSALLDRMQAESDSDETAFVDARVAGGWDAAVRARLGAGAATALRDPLERWIRAGLANTSGGRLVGTIGADDSEPDAAVLTLQTVAGLPPEALGISAENAATWYSSSPADDVFFGSTLDIDPSVLLLGGALAPSTTEVEGTETIAEALAASVSCDAIALELVARGAAAEVAYPGCDGSCIQSLCEDSLAELVTDLEERDEENASSLELAASAEANVGSEAELVGLQGTWVGRLECEGAGTDVGGVVLAPAP